LDALAGHAFARVASAQFSSGNAVRLLRDGPENYPAWLGAIAAAERNVHLENYIIEDDAVGRSFADALIDATGRGVRCLVLYDWLGCRGRAPARFWSRLRRNGVDVRSYNPARPAKPLGWLSRDHRKILCVDGTVGFTGGLCIGHEWKGDPEHGIAPWRDTAVEIRGPAVRDLDMAFADSWASTGPPIPNDDAPRPDSDEHAGEHDVLVIAGKPESMGLYRLQQLLAEIVEESLWLTDAYFVASTGYVRALTGAARNGVDVRLLVPGSSDIPVIQELSRAGYRALLEAGVRIFEWNGPMLHAKTAVADGRLARIGSSNSNLASWIANRELDVTTTDPRLAAEMAAMFENDLGNATEIMLRSRRVTPSSPEGERPARGTRKAQASRLVAGAVGIGSSANAAIARHRHLDSSESRVLAVAGAIAMAFAAAALLMPDLIAYPAAAMAIWVGATLLARAWRLRRSDEP